MSLPRSRSRKFLRRIDSTRLSVSLLNTVKAPFLTEAHSPGELTLQVIKMFFVVWFTLCIAGFAIAFLEKLIFG